MTASRVTGSCLDARTGARGGRGIERPARARRRVETVDEAEAQPLQPGPGDHRRVVGAQAPAGARRNRARPIAAKAARRCRSRALAATPPAATSAPALGWRGAEPGDRIARCDRTSASQIAASTAAARSRRSCGSSGSFSSGDTAHRGLQPGKREVAAGPPDQSAAAAQTAGRRRPRAACSIAGPPG